MSFYVLLFSFMSFLAGFRFIFLTTIVTTLIQCLTTKPRARFS